MDENLEHVEIRESLKPLLDALEPREKKILLLRFFKNRTQTQIAEEIGVSQMHVSRLLDPHPRPAADLAGAVVMTRLSGKVAVITGAARGIGRATLEVFLAEGARVVATDLDGTTLAEVAGDALTVVGDVSVEDDARAMIEAAVSTYGRIDVLVANAGVIPLSTIDQTSAADWDHVMAVDGRGMFLTCKFAIEHMARTRARARSCCCRRSPGSAARSARRRTDPPSTSPPASPTTSPSSGRPAASG